MPKQNEVEVFADMSHNHIQAIVPTLVIKNKHEFHVVVRGAGWFALVRRRERIESVRISVGFRCMEKALQRNHASGQTVGSINRVKDALGLYASYSLYVPRSHWLTHTPTGRRADQVPRVDL